MGEPQTYPGRSECLLCVPSIFMTLDVDKPCNLSGLSCSICNLLIISDVSSSHKEPLKESESSVPDLY